MPYADILSAKTLVLGCGNPLFGDDGFGPAVIEALENASSLPEGCVVLDAGTSVREILFDICVSPEAPDRVIVVDAHHEPGCEPGRIREIGVEGLAHAKLSDFSMHQFPTMNLLAEFAGKTGKEVRVFVAQTCGAPDSMAPGMSPAVEAAVGRMARFLLKLIHDPKTQSKEMEEE
ncbi:coenzyme F420 hydrogenase subunit delta [Desulfatibacillum alkenivorans DSM 16219]|uniref:Coenzyme F420 hydrogenase subunit delta n=1 Tax=Desulfatibacillum alkenivorans DSM 16219 TaxID=1121393 RepID=A0A1M6YE45_9BACT|nr:hydrogenase maturation protease [Desulfatibacillum alkenivorans]SHL16259.1 coenzyme F420 hydrogenase subunit delta [Desulfatibacillum alkenivorans DSM 16219]